MNLIDILVGTPYWIWGLLVYLLINGAKAIKPSEVHLWRLSIMPTIFIVWSLYSIYGKCQECPKMVLLWFIFLCTGFFLGYSLYRKVSCTINSKTNLIKLPGTYIPLLLGLTFFCSKYILGVTYALNPAMKTNLMILSIDLILSGLISGISLGRLGFFVKMCTYDKKFN